MQCSIERLVGELLTVGDNSAVVDDLAGLPGMLARRGEPESTMRWLIKPRTQEMLTSIAQRTTDDSLTHATLDTCEVRARHYLRAMLVELRVLPPRDEPIERFETWINELTASLPAPHARLIGPYGRWSVLRRARRRARRRGFTESAANTTREQIRTAVRFVEYIDAHGRQIGDLTQTILDDWTAGNPDRTKMIAGFVKWLTQRDIIDNVVVVQMPKAPPSEIGHEDDHTRRIAELLDNTSDIELTTRVAGLLVLLYGARLERIRQLTTADITVTADGVYVKLADHPLELPSRVADLVVELAAVVETNPRARTLDDTAHHLFPGGRPREPIHATTLCRKLNGAGMPVRIHRNRAMLALTTDLPAAVVATQLGVSISAATNWARFAQRDRTEYLIARQDTRVDWTDSSALRPDRSLATASFGGQDSHG